MFGELNQHLQGQLEQLLDISLCADSLDVAQWLSVDQTHHNSMSVGVYRTGSAESILRK